MGSAAKKLGRPPHRGELPRVAGVSHSAVLKHFASLRDAVRAAGMEPSRQGLKVPAEDLLEDFARVGKTLGHSPNRKEYVRHGKYAAGTFYARFGSWGAIAKAASGAAGLTAEKQGEKGPQQHEGDKAIAMRWAAAVPALPGDLAGKRRVTDAVCAMIVNTLMGEEAGLRWQRAMMGDGAGENCQTLARMNGAGTAGLALVNGSVTSGGILDGNRPVMGPPFYPCALSNAPINEMGVILLFGMLAGELGFQIEAVQGKYPDIEAKRQIQPGKWQRVRIEAEFESRNFALHGHDPAECDIIVCWRHNWAKCPEHIEVIELSKVLEERLRR